MEPSCVRQTSLPGTSKLFGDYLYSFERVSDFYPAYSLDLDGLTESARTVRFSDTQRLRTVAALRKQNPGSKALERLAQTGTVAVVTGQQVGLLSGPAYTVYKALTAVRLAQELCERGVEAVPVFWLATEDHDVAEVDHAWVYNQYAAPTRVAVKAPSLENIPVGNVALEGLPLDVLRSALGELPFAPEVLEKVAEHYGSMTSFGRAFYGFLKDILEPFDLIFLDPLQPEIREAISPFLGEVAQRVPELTAALRHRNAELEKRGYHAQVHVDNAASLLFLLEGDRRTALRYRDGMFLAKDKSYTAGDLAALDGQVSPNALLRPVMQDFLLPTVSYVGGPSEIAYFAQSQVLYDRLLGRMPSIYPRNSFTLLDSRALKLLDRYGLHVEDLLDSQDRVRAKVAGKLVPQDVRGEMRKVRSQLEELLGGVREKLLHFDSTLAAATDKSLSKIRYQLDKLTGKVARETMRRDDRAEADANYLMNLIYPHRHLQERFYSIVPFLAEHGLDLPNRLYQYVQLTCPDHMVRSL